MEALYFGQQIDYLNRSAKLEIHDEPKASGGDIAQIVA